MEPDWDRLVDMVRASGRELGVRAVLLAGSWARGLADPASDVDLLAIIKTAPRSIQSGCHGGRFVEVLYAPLDDLEPLPHPPNRATFQGARILYDPEGVARAWLARLEQYLATADPPGSTLLPYRVWGLRHTLQALEVLAEANDTASLLYLRNRFVDELVLYLYTKAGVWAPGVRRQLDGLGSIRPDGLPLITGILAAVAPQDVAGAARRAYEGLVEEPPEAHLTRAPLVPLD